MEILFLVLAFVLAAAAVPAWLYRGGSINGGNVPSFLKPRFMRLAATPVAVGGALTAAFATSWFDAGLLAVATLIFAGVSSWGWLNSSDLGRDGDRGFWHELGLMHVRFLPFALAAIPAWFVSPFAAIPFVALGLFGPEAWLPEKFFYFDKGKAPKFAVAETVIGIALAATTIFGIVLALI